MLKDLLKHAKSMANIKKIWRHLSGERILATFTDCQGTGTTYVRIVFESKYSLCIANNGAFWVDGPSITEQVLVRLIEKLVPYKEQYDSAVELFAKLYGGKVSQNISCNHDCAMRNRQ